MSANSATNIEVSKPTVVPNSLSSLAAGAASHQHSPTTAVSSHSSDIADLRYTMEQQHLQQMKLKQLHEQQNHPKLADMRSSSQDIQTTESTINSTTNQQSEDNANSSSSSGGNAGTGPKIINFKNNIQQTTAANPDVSCSNCGTTKTPLWRRDERGYILCNACGLFFKLHGKPRPISLKTDVIRSRNRKTKIEKQKEKDLLSRSTAVNASGLSSTSSNSKNSIRKRRKKVDTISASNMKSNGLISSAALLGSSGNNASDDILSAGSNSNGKSSAGSAVYSQSNGLIKIVPKSDADYHHQQQSLNQHGINITNNSYNLSIPGQSVSSASSNGNANNKIIVLPQKLNAANSGNTLLSLSSLGVSPRLGPMWQQSSQLSQAPQMSSFKSPPMLAIDKLASVSRQVSKPIPAINDIALQPLNNREKSSGSNNTVLPPITHFQENASMNTLTSHNKLPNLKNILSAVENINERKPLSITSVLNKTSTVKVEINKDEQIKKLTTENKELEIKLDICKNKIQELEHKLLNPNTN